MYPREAKDDIPELKFLSRFFLPLAEGPTEIPDGPTSRKVLKEADRGVKAGENSGSRDSAGTFG